MSKVVVEMGLTLNQGNFNNFKPLIRYEVDTDENIDEQLEACRLATKQITTAVSDEMEQLLDREGMKNFETTTDALKKAMVVIEERITNVENSQVTLESDVDNMRSTGIGSGVEGVNYSALSR